MRMAVQTRNRLLILKTNLYTELTAQSIKENSFVFALVTGIGRISPKEDVTISSGKVVLLKTTLCGLEGLKRI
jgi:hypothetical protein